MCAYARFNLCNLMGYFEVRGAHSGADDQQHATPNIIVLLFGWTKSVY